MTHDNPSSNWPPALPDSLAAAVVRVDRLHALATVLSSAEGGAQFACLTLREQVAVFGLFADQLAEARTAMMVLAQADAGR
ncbi:hypothetical protein AAB992_14085 [Burkholderia contaminans]|uniref:hypothetical protein n=1 Tax=Burkholderia contaminans TaxID=488447 RepID=UPI0024165C84|nr:hypothetical protein [Burkholderia contaminans]WFN14397.1 hypothetical protein LXE92_36430 [Burkholderia contaminans]